jgi:hypothetical protein
MGTNIVPQTQTGKDKRFRHGLPKGFHLFFGVPVCRIKHYFGSPTMAYFFGVHSTLSGTAGVTGLGDPEQIARGSVVTLRYE